MMMALAGFIPKVIGNNKAMAAAGPKPGNTPTNVPYTQPRKQYTRFIGLAAIDNPYPKLSHMSLSFPSFRDSERLNRFPISPYPQRTSANIQKGSNLRKS